MRPTQVPPFIIDRLHLMVADLATASTLADGAVGSIRVEVDMRSAAKGVGVRLAVSLQFEMDEPERARDPADPDHGGS